MTQGIGKHTLKDAGKALGYITAGKAILSVEDIPSKSWMTFKVEQKILREDNSKNGKEIGREDLWFVRLLTGSDNSNDYSYLCYVRKDAKGRFWIKTSAKSLKGEKADEAVQTLKDVFTALEKGKNPFKKRLWHNGFCGRCGKLLTVPGSVETGLGPVCLGKQGETPEIQPIELVSPCGHPRCDGKGTLTFKSGSTKNCPLCAANNPEGEPEPKPVYKKTCKYCGEGGLHWVETEHGWRLFNDAGDMHVCMTSDQPDDDTPDTAPEPQEAPKPESKPEPKSSKSAGHKNGHATCQKCGQKAYWHKSKKTGAWYLTTSPFNRTSFHSKVCTG